MGNQKEGKDEVVLKNDTSPSLIEEGRSSCDNNGTMNTENDTAILGLLCKSQFF